MFNIDLNCDCGESFGRYKLGIDEEIIKYITSANIACGFHGGDPLVIESTVKLAKDNGVSIGAHPGFLDLMGFGRRNMELSFNEAKAYTTYQIGALYAFCKSLKVDLIHIKPHGAMYNMATKDEKLSRAICESIYEFDKDLIILAPYNSAMIKIANDIGIKYAKEAFVDRAYEEDGSLVSRSKEGAIIEDENEAIDRVIDIIKRKKVKSISGKYIDIEADSICVHGDNIKALEFLKNIRTSLELEKINIAPFKEFIY
ncbi:MAG: 5-oxoprolinase subunit PxpA [Peptostreptococcaceae bacterium]